MADRVWSYCEQNSDLTVIYYSYILAPIHVLAASFTLFILFSYIKTMCQHQMESSRSQHLLSFLSIALFLCSFCFLSAIAIRNVLLCRSAYFAEYQMVFNISAQLYVAQFFPLIGILYGRLHRVFQGSALGLSRCTNITFAVAFTVYILCAVAAALLYAKDASFLSSIATTIAGLLTFTLIISLVSAFISKLHTVYKYSRHQARSSITTMDDDGKIVCDDTIKNLITKVSLLAILPLSCTMVSVVCVAILPMTTRPHFDFVFGFVSVTDTLLNVVCVSLMVNHFSAYYQAVCGKCDAAWNRIWTQCTAPDAEKKHVQPPTPPTPARVVSISVTIERKAGSDQVDTQTSPSETGN